MKKPNMEAKLSFSRHSTLIKYNNRNPIYKSFLIFSLITFLRPASNEIKETGVLCKQDISSIRDNTSNKIRDGAYIIRTNRAVYLAIDESNLSRGSQNYTTSHNYNHQEQPPILDQCCACDEAKYELVFEGLWSKYTHPDEFPEDHSQAYFSDIIGASHSNEFRMWTYDSYASDGVKELAESGSTKKLESELKQVSSKTRTIIKARGLHYPTLNTKTTAVFRTDRQHHLVSVLSKLAPSPDWMVGVSGLELCQGDCTWAVQRVLNLYLWDAGTSSGSTFSNSANMPTIPQARIRFFRAGSQQNNNFGRQSDTNMTRSYDQIGGYIGGERQQVEATNSVNTDQLKPYARLTITRQRIYEKSCSGDSISNLRHETHQISSLDSTIEPTRPTFSDCRFTDWSDWSSCSSTCGRGIRTRTRSFIKENAHLTGSCSQADLIEKEVCLSECIGNTTCVTRDWSEWSHCSVDCGHGHRKRTRSPIGILKRSCRSLELVQIEPCQGDASFNGQTIDCSNHDAPTPCKVTEWSQWSECSVACGKGVRIRTRQYVRKEDSERCTAQLIQKQMCNGRPELCKQVSRGQNMVAATNYRATKSNPNLPVIDCKLSAWSPWSTCSALCGSGKRTRSRYIIQMPQNGGKPCDKKLSRTQKCKDLPPCPSDYNANAVAATTTATMTNHQNSNGHLQRGTTASSKSILNRFSDVKSLSTTTSSSSIMDDEDDSKFSRLLKSESDALQQASLSPTLFVVEDGHPTTTELELIAEKEHLPDDDDSDCRYGNWSQWSECEVVCQPVRRGSNKVRQKFPIEGYGSHCQIIEELFYCDPSIYC